MKRKSFLQTILPAALATFAGKQLLAMPDPPARTGFGALPPYLKPGDTIAITCSASPQEAAGLRNCKKQLEDWGFKIQFGDTVGKQWQRFGGTDEERAADLQRLLDDSTVNSILFGRGGYGIMRMMDKINWEQFRRHPKWLIGFSDITAFHCHLNNFPVPTIHADMGNGFNGTEDDAAITLHNVLTGNRINYNCDGFTLNRPGTASGELVGGNLSLLCAMQGSKSELQTAGKILLIEDVSEYKYTVDRMLMNLKRSGKLDGLAGLIVGGFTATKEDTESNFPMTMEELIYEKVQEFNYPVCFHFPAGHQKLNFALKLGVQYNFSVSKTLSQLVEATPANGLQLQMDTLRLQDTLRIKDSLHIDSATIR